MKRILLYCFLSFGLLACRKFDRTDIHPDIMDVGTNVDLFGIDFRNDSVGYTVGGKRNQYGYVFKTSDGGQTWTKTLLEGDLCAYTINFMNDSIGWIGSDFIRLTKTTDAGQTWSIHWFQADELAFHEENRPSIKQIQCIGDSAMAFVAGENYQTGNVYRSNDLGASWSFDTLNAELHSVSYLNKDIGFIAGYGYLGKTNDAGKNFEKLKFDGDYFTGVAMLNANEIVAVGNNGGIYKSNNGGNSWKVILSHNGAFSKRRAFNKLKFIDSNTGFAIGQYGLIMKTMDSGNTWTLLKTNEQTHLNDLSFTSTKVYIAANNGKILTFDIY